MADYYSHGSTPSQGSLGSSATLRAEFDAIEQGISNKLAPLTGNGGKIIAVNSTGTAQEAVATTGAGNAVLANSPTLVTPALGTPSALVLTNATGLPAASAINTPAGNIAATNVQAAINELDTKKVSSTAVIDIAHGGTGSTTPAAARTALGVPDGIGKNKLINPNFAINQRGVSGAVVLAAGAYGHDRFKAGVGGCTYTFATALNVTTITISAGTLMQVIEGVNLFSGTHTLSWVGTATARVDAGAYSASGITGTAVGGTNQTIEFGTGTVSKVQYEMGAVATTFEQRSIQQELALCQRYYEICTVTYRGNVGVTIFVSVSGSYKVTKRASSTLSLSGSITQSNVSTDEVVVNSSAPLEGYRYNLNATASSLDTYIFDRLVIASSEL